MLFKELVKQTFPQTILDNKASVDIIDILLDFIEEKSSISYDISKVFTCDKNAELKTEFVNTYLENISTTFKQALLDQNIKDKLNKVYDDLSASSGTVYTYDSASIPDISEVFTTEYLNVAKQFKQKKGTVPAIEFAYNVFRQSKIQQTDINSEMQDESFNVILGTPSNPKEPFTFQVEGSLYKEIYENTVKPIVHPVGFAYIYTKILSLLFVEYVNLKLTYYNTNIVIVCNNGETIDEQFQGKEIKLIEDNVDVDNRVQTKIIFADNTYLVKDYNTTVKYLSPGLDGDINTQDDVVLIEYANSCALSLTYSVKLETSLTDSYDCESQSYFEEIYRLGGISFVGDVVVGSFVVSKAAEEYGMDIESFLNAVVNVQVAHEYDSQYGSGIVYGATNWAYNYTIITEQFAEDNYVVINSVDDNFEIEIIPV